VGGAIFGNRFHPLGVRLSRVVAAFDPEAGTGMAQRVHAVFGRIPHHRLASIVDDGLARVVQDRNRRRQRCYGASLPLTQSCHRSPQPKCGRPPGVVQVSRLPAHNLRRRIEILTRPTSEAADLR
jgi:hypothetical protein